MRSHAVRSTMQVRCENACAICTQRSRIPQIEGLLCTRGGWGSAELLPHLDAKLLARANPKVFAGYSDHTSLHVWLWNELRMMTFYAPMVAADWSNMDGVHRATWHAAVEAKSKWSVNSQDGLRVCAAARSKAVCWADASRFSPKASAHRGRCASTSPPCSSSKTSAPSPTNGTDAAASARRRHAQARARHHPRRHDRECEARRDATARSRMPHALEEFVGPDRDRPAQRTRVGQNRSLPLGAWVRMNDDTVEESFVSSAKHVHLIGICGTAMASLAGMLRAQGHRVTGSDTAAYPPMSDQLRAMGIPILSRTLQEPRARPDLVVVGNAISRGNAELEVVLNERIPMTSMAALIHDEFLQGRERFVVCGNARQDHNHEHARLDLETASRMKTTPALEAVVSHRRGRRKFRQQLPRAGRHVSLHPRGRRVRHRLLRQGTKVPALLS